MRSVIAIVFTLSFAAPVIAQERYLVADRTNRRILLLSDTNTNEVIDEPAEVSTFFDASNAAGTSVPSNFFVGAINVRDDGLVVVTDNNNRSIYLLRDLNNNGNAQDANESVIAVTSSNGSGAQFNAGLGIAFKADGTVFVSNSGASGTSDAIYRLAHVDCNRDSNAAGEIEPYVTDGPSGFGTGNTAYVPGEIWFDASGTGFVHDSGTLHGIYRFRDADASGRADDDGEFAPYLTSGNSSGITLSAGFALEPDAARPGALYIINSPKQIIRVTDTNTNGTANDDVNGSAVVYVTTESTVSPNDLVSLANGDVLFADITGRKVYRLRDLNTDGNFGSGATAERTVYWANALPTPLAADVRYMAALVPWTTAGTGDMNGDGMVDPADVPAFVGVLLNPAGSTKAARQAADVNWDGVADACDIDMFVNRVLGF